MNYMELMLFVCVCALAVISIMLSLHTRSLSRRMDDALSKEREMARSYIRYAHPGAAFVPEQTTGEKKHRSLASRQADAMEYREGDAK